MPVFIEWKWVEKTETFVVVFHFWDDGQKENLRMRIENEGFETCIKAEEGEDRESVPIMTVPHYKLGYPRTKAYLSWAPSHFEFCFLTELLTYANLINGLKPDLRRKLRPKLEVTNFEIDSSLLKSMPEGTMISFTGQKGISFEVCLKYIEYIRKTLKPYI